MTGHPFADASAIPRGVVSDATRSGGRGEQSRSRGSGVEHDDIAVGKSEGPDLRRGESYVGAHEGRMTRGRTSESDDRSNGPRRQPATRSIPHGFALSPRPAHVVRACGAECLRRPVIESRLAVLMPCSIRRRAVYL